MKEFQSKTGKKNPTLKVIWKGPVSFFHPSTDRG